MTTSGGSAARCLTSCIYYTQVILKADGWVLITVETGDLYFYPDATAQPERNHF